MQKHRNIRDLQLILLFWLFFFVVVVDRDIKNLT